jgi:hypothetical protein
MIRNNRFVIHRTASDSEVPSRVASVVARASATIVTRRRADETRRAKRRVCRARARPRPARGHVARRRRTVAPVDARGAAKCRGSRDARYAGAGTRLLVHVHYKTRAALLIRDGDGLV